MTRFQTKTGEETVVFARGALIPTTPPEKLGEFWTSLFFSGGDLQIFDKEAGMMDVTYSLTWTLDKTLTLADTTFTEALGILRALTEIFVMDKAKQGELSKHEE